MPEEMLRKQLKWSMLVNDRVAQNRLSNKTQHGLDNWVTNKKQTRDINHTRQLDEEASSSCETS